MIDDIEHWRILEHISISPYTTQKIELFRYYAHLEAHNKINSLVQMYINDFSKKQAKNPLLTIVSYNLQCQSFVTPFLFQPPIFPCNNKDERIYFNKLFSNWDCNSYCLIFYDKMRNALGL